MPNFVAVWNQLSAQRKLTLMGVVAATVAGLWLLVSFASTPRMVLLYGGLDPAAAGDVLGALESMDVEADARGDSIYVPEAKRDSVRMALARQGLPQQGQPGFELLDEMNGFATTAEMFDAAYWRAKEGELARTILSTPGVRAARVHLAVPKASSFSRQNRAPSASATISMKRGKLDAQKATAIRYLIALAVPNLEPVQVAVIDSVNGVILKPGAETPMAAAGSDQADRSKQMEQNLLSLLEARVGPGSARVTVSLDIDRERETVSERLLDPNSRVLMSRETTDLQQSDVGTPGAVTVASNLPDGEAGGAQQESRSNRSETNENTKFDISEVHRQREKLPGAISRINVAVLIDHLKAAEEGLEPEARPQEELDAIADLVKASIGFDEARGDVVTVRSMPFHQFEGAEELVESGGVVQYLQERLVTILQIVIPAIVVLVLALFVLKPVLMQEATAAPAPAPAISEQPLQMQQVEHVNSPVDDLRNVASENQEATMAVLKSWLGDTERAA